MPDTHTHTQCAWQKGLCVCLVSGATLGMLPFWGLCTVWSLAAGLQLNCQSHSGLVICVRQMLLSALCAPLCYLRTHTVLLMYFSVALLYKLFERTTLVFLLIVVRRADVHFWLAGLESSNCSFWIILKGLFFLPTIFRDHSVEVCLSLLDVSTSYFSGFFRLLIRRCIFSAPVRWAEVIHHWNHLSCF